MKAPVTGSREDGRLRWFAPVAGVVAMASAAPAGAWEYGPFAVETLIEIQNDTVVDSNDSAGKISDTYLTIETAVSMALGASSSLNLALTFEPMTDPYRDRFFEDEGLYAEELFLSHDLGGAELMLGKFNPAFGVAWYEAPGIYGTDFAEDYQLTEQVGGAVLIPFNIGASENAISVAVFNADRTILSKSLGRRRDQNSLLAGGVGNTDAPESIAIAMNGQIGATSYNFGVQSLAKGEGDTHDQRGAVLGVAHMFDPGRPVSVMAELAYFPDFGGTALAARYGTFGVAAPFGPVTVAGVYGWRKLDGERADHLATLTGEIELAPNLIGSLGYRYGREGPDRTHAIGTLISYLF